MLVPQCVCVCVRVCLERSLRTRFFTSEILLFIMPLCVSDSKSDTEATQRKAKARGDQQKLEKQQKLRLDQK